MTTESAGSMQQRTERIQRLWQRLQTTAGFSYISSPGPASQTGWQGSGQGRVTVERQGSDELHFAEVGEFTLASGQTVVMHNRFIWQKRPSGLALSHGRRGEPVFLFELVPLTEGVWRSVQDHVCIHDLYSGELTEKSGGFTLVWHIRGPKKDEQLFYHYFPDNS